MNQPQSADAFGTTPGALPREAESPFAASDMAQQSADDLQRSPGSSNEMTDQLTAMIDTAMQRGDELMLSCRNQIRAHPMSTVGVAFVAGMLFDRLFRGSR